MKVRASNGAVVNNSMWRIVPRIGFAYDVFGNGTTSIHGGWGLFNNKIGDLSYVDGIRTNPPQFANPVVSAFTAGTTLANFSYGTSTGGATGFPTPPGILYFQTNAAGGLVGSRIQGVGGMQPNLVFAPVACRNWSIGIQRSLGRSVVAEADYFGTSSTHLYFQTDSNRFAGDLLVNKRQPCPAQSQLRCGLSMGRSIGISNAEVASFAISKIFSRGWSVHAIYNIGKALDYTSSNDNGVGGAENVIDVNNPRRNYGRADYDARHRISVDAVWNVPGLKGTLANLITRRLDASLPSSFSNLVNPLPCTPQRAMHPMAPAATLTRTDITTTFQTPRPSAIPLAPIARISSRAYSHLRLFFQLQPRVPKAI